MSFIAITLQKNLILCILYGVYIVMFSVNIVKLINGDATNYFMLCFTPLFFMLIWFLYRKSVKVMLKRDSELYGDEPLFTLQITDEKIILLTKNGSSSEIEYHNVGKVVKTKNLILILTKAKSVFILRKGGFIKGNEAQLLSFLKSKGVTVK